MAGENWTFFQAFLKAPKVVASVTPSSTFLKRRVIRAADLAAARVVVELGPGTGGLSEALLDAMAAESTLLAIERTATFVDALERIRDPRFEVVHGCASEIVEELERRGLAAADAVVSGIPFSTMPDDLSARIAGAVHAALRPGGRFVAYQFTDRVVDYARPVLGDPDVEHEVLNVPPMRVFRWVKAAPPAAARLNGARVDL